MTWVARPEDCARSRGLRDARSAGEPFPQRPVGCTRRRYRALIPLFRCCGLASLGDRNAGHWTHRTVRISSGPKGGLRMLKVLIVEDDLMLADFAEEILVEHGYEVSGIARTVADAVALHGIPGLTLSSSICGWPTVGSGPKSQLNCRRPWRARHPLMSPAICHRSFRSNRRRRLSCQSSTIGRSRFAWPGNRRRDRRHRQSAAAVSPRVFSCLPARRLSRGSRTR